MATTEIIDQLIEVRDNRDASDSFVGYEGGELPPEPLFFETIFGRIVEVLFIFVAIIVAWIAVLS